MVKNENPLITVAIPTYNDSRFLIESLKCALEQTYSNIEVLVVDDGSSISEKENIQSIQRSVTDERLKFIYNEHVGAGGARNSAIKNAQGEYICFIDVDDKVTTTYVEDMVKAAIETDSDIVVCGRKTYYKGSLYAVNGGKLFYTVENKEAVKKVMTLEDNFHIAVCKLYRTVFLRENDLFFPTEVLYEDMTYAIDTSSYAKTVSYIPCFNYFYMARDNSRSMTVYDKMFTDYAIALSEVIKSILKTRNVVGLREEWRIFFLESLFRVNKWFQMDIEHKCLNAYLNTASWITNVVSCIQKSETLENDLRSLVEKLS